MSGGAARRRNATATDAATDPFEVLGSVTRRLDSAAADRLDVAIRKALETVVRHVGVDRATVLVFSPDRRTFSVTHEWCAPGITPSADYMVDVPLVTFPWSSKRLLAGTPLLINTLDDFPPEAAADGQMLADEGMQSMLAIPMVTRGRVTGAITLDALRQPCRWSPFAIALTHALGSLIVTHLDRRLMEQHARTVSRMERDKLGRDLHDSLGQNLVAISLLAASLQNTLGSRHAAAAAKAAQIASLAAGVAQTARDMIHGLHPADFSGEGLQESLRLMAAETSRLFGVRCRFSDEGTPLVRDLEACTQLFWIAREATNNAIRHGKARRIAITMTMKGRRQCLTIQDDGKGLGKGWETGGGAGVKVMKFRASLLGGHLVIEPGVRGGTVIACVFPVGGVAASGASVPVRGRAPQSDMNAARGVRRRAPAAERRNA